MNRTLLAQSHFTVSLDVPLGAIDLGDWLFSLRDDEYRACSKAHIAAGSSRTPDGRRMSINVENPGGTLLVQHYIEDASDRMRCRVSSDTDAFTPFGQTKYIVIWEVALVREGGESGCTFKNSVEVYTTEGFPELLAQHGVSMEAASLAAQKVLEEHNAEETPLFAKNIEAKARAEAWSLRA